MTNAISLRTAYLQYSSDVRVHSGTEKPKRGGNQGTLLNNWNRLNWRFCNPLAMKVVGVVCVVGIYVRSPSVHGLLRRLNVTRQSSYQSAQYSAFAFHRNCYVVLNLKGERRLYGWPKEWPSRSDEKHFLIEECEWLDGNKRRPTKEFSHILIPASEVDMVEFLPANYVSEHTEKNHDEPAPLPPIKFVKKMRVQDGVTPKPPTAVKPPPPPPPPPKK